jgi:predicted nucleotide-binding protein
MERVQGQIDVLLKEGENFTYENFSTKGRYGHPNAYTPEWVAWRTRTKSLIDRLAGPGSAPAEMVSAGLRVDVIGWDRDKFELAQSHLLGALRAARQMLQDDVFEERQTNTARAPGTSSNRVFVVHGHDEARKNQLEGLLIEMGLDPIVLHRKPDEGLTIIEKFEKYSDVGFAFILLTPDEVACLASEMERPEDERRREKRARPNVIFEFGFFVGRLGRQNVCCLHTGDVELPSDLGGFLYKAFKDSVEEVGWGIAKELRARGYALVVNRDTGEDP